eukprot:TRINITY_DN67461_c1_g1_i1.p1 TRINITY_DN67461_c1_g1~~TRINITY_DN67461_c1_g1_i1.p1  ORF type:complete len:525 (-),score=76.24 TRINITY_DN67461_c1_g1_i1:2104-3678(-)
MTSTQPAQVTVNSENVRYTADTITTRYTYQTTAVQKEGDRVVVTPTSETYQFQTQKNVPKTGVMLVGLGGNNGSTFAATVAANKHNITWRSRIGHHTPDYFGSITQSSTVRMGYTAENEEVNVPLNGLVPLLNPNDIVIGGWDISNKNLADAMERSCVLEYDLQRQLRPYLEEIVPLPSIMYTDFVAQNQSKRASNILPGNAKLDHLNTIRKNIRDFKADNKLDKVIVLWTATTERFSEVIAGINDTAENFLASVEKDHPEVSPSSIFATAAILEGCAYINGSPQNTFVPGVIELAHQNKVFIAGDDFKSGQTKLKSVLVEFLVGAGIKPLSIASYNHLGNNDGYNLSSPAQFRSKEISKSNVVDDMVASNQILYKEGEHPDHCVVIKYVPAVGDSKRAMDEYTSQILMGGRNTMAIHNTCEDSLLAVPLIVDLVTITELFQRVQYSKEDTPENWAQLDPILSILSYLCKAPLVTPGTPLVNALFRQKCCIENILRSLVGIPPENHMLLEFKTLQYPGEKKTEN